MSLNVKNLPVSCTKHDKYKTMHAVEWHGKASVDVTQRPAPIVTDEKDAILKVTTTAICGSDLHLYLNTVPGMHKGDVLGHEFMGIVESVGPGVKTLKVGDRVISSFDMGCGECEYCKEGLFSSCDRTNPSVEMEELYGHRTSGMHGFSHLTGGWEGGQASYARVPFADVNCLKVPPGMHDKDVILLSDVLATAWHANELGEVHEGDTVAIWGAGPVGMLAAQCAVARGAKKVALIDSVQYRLKYATGVVPGVHTIDRSKQDVKKALAELFGQGPRVAIECVGIHYTMKTTTKVEMATGLATDPSDTINELINCVRKGGRISVIGVYAGFCNQYNIGAFMEKGLSMAAGQTPVQKYWHKLLKMVQEGTLNPAAVITHEVPLERAAEMYKIFNEKLDGCVKVIMHPAGASVA
jgi:threonine dehydrogenase-like Zn-dependent dehydrogenase